MTPARILPCLSKENTERGNEEKNDNRAVHGMEGKEEKRKGEDPTSRGRKLHTVGNTKGQELRTGFQGIRRELGERQTQASVRFGYIQNRQGAVERIERL